MHNARPSADAGLLRLPLPGSGQAQRQLCSSAAVLMCRTLPSHAETSIQPYNNQRCPLALRSGQFGVAATASESCAIARSFYALGCTHLAMALISYHRICICRPRALLNLPLYFFLTTPMVGRARMHTHTNN